MGAQPLKESGGRLGNPIGRIQVSHSLLRPINNENVCAASVSNSNNVYSAYATACLWGINPIGKFNEYISFWKAVGGFGLLVLHVLQQEKTTLEPLGKINWKRWMLCLGGGFFCIIYNSSNSAESCRIVLILYLLRVMKMNQSMASGGRKVNNREQQLLLSHFKLGLFFSPFVFPAVLLSFYFGLFFFSRSFGHLNCSLHQLWSSDGPVPACSLPAFWLVSVLRGMRNIYALGSSSPLAWNDL